MFLFTKVRFKSLKCLFNVQETWEPAINHEVFLINFPPPLYYYVIRSTELWCFLIYRTRAGH